MRARPSAVVRLGAVLEPLNRAVSGQPQHRTDQVAGLIDLAQMAHRLYEETGAPGHGVLLRGVLRDFWAVVASWEDDDEDVSLSDLLAEG